MDNLTHTLVGVALAEAGPARRFGRGTTLLLAVASNLPDVDALLLVAGVEDSFAVRRTLTHSVVGVPLLAAGLAAVFRAFRRDATYRSLFGLALLGAALHVFFDLLNSYGVVLLWPLSNVRLELAWVFIIDLAAWGVLLAPNLLRLTPLRRLGVQNLYRVALFLLAAYLGACAAGHWRATRLLAHAAAQDPRIPDFTHVFPEPLGPHRWRGVVRYGDEYRTWLLRAVPGEAVPVGRVGTDARLPAVRAVRETVRGRRLEWFFKAPVWRLRCPEGEVEVFDLRFQSLVLPRDGMPFLKTLSAGAAACAGSTP